MTGEKGEEHKAERDDKGRDIEIRDEFDFADYLMKDVIGYFQYVNASVQSASSQDKISRLPEKVLPFTHSWDITYSPEILVKKMDKNFYFYHTRSSLLSLVSIFEVALRSFAARLNEEKKHDSIFRGIDPENCGYKTLLKKAFDFATSNKESLYGGAEDNENKKKIQRVPDLCCDVDEARRLRNLFMHNHGLFDTIYGTDTIKVPDRLPTMRQQFLKEFLEDSKQEIPTHFTYEQFSEYMKEFLKEPKHQVPVLLTPEEIIQCSRSHIELLHYLHDLIQREYFGLTDAGYYYPHEQPRLKPKWAEWDRIFSGGQP